MRQFTVTTDGENRLGLRELCERFVNDQWFAAHASNELAAEALLDQFKRAIRGELKLLEVRPDCPARPTRGGKRRGFLAPD